MYQNKQTGEIAKATVKGEREVTVFYAGGKIVNMTLAEFNRLFTMVIER